MIALTRTDTSLVGQWWWTVDRWTVVAVAGLVGFGGLLAMAASPAVATRLAVEPFYFAARQMAFFAPALLLMFAVSLMTPLGVRRLAYLVFALAMVLLIATFFIGVEVKGARRWIDLGLISIQPSEFIKPAFVVITAWLFAAHRNQENSNGNLIAMALFLLVVGMLVMQPDIGMTAMVSTVWFCQFVLAGLALHWIVGFLLLGASGMVGAYFLLPHVTSRVDRFLDPSSGDSYQVNRSLEAFMNGGLFGRGPGEGNIKSVLPDAHSDFIFAVAGEELGVLACLLIVGLFTLVVLRGLSRALRENSLFVMLASAGLAIQFGLQAAINMGSSLRLIPAKGMTLPFISYGGSSLIAVALTVGMLLALTRRRVGQDTE
jgi:cell division protein FtsW